MRSTFCARFQQLNTLCITGTVFSGKGEGAKYVGLPWVKEQIIRKLGFVPYVGTLNIRLTEDDAKRLVKVLEKVKAIEISPVAGFRRGKCYRASLADGIECAIVIPDVTDHSEDVLEIVAPVNLRDRFHLGDGDLLDIRVHL
jgi:riboflavin kinase